MILCPFVMFLRFRYDTDTIALRVFGWVRLDAAGIAQILAIFHYDLQVYFKNTAQKL